MQNKVKQISTLIGSCLLHFMIGSGNTFGNLNTYITSYLRQNGSKDANYGQSVWYTAVGVTAFTVSTILSGLLAKKIGTRLSCLVGTIILCGSIALTSIALKHSFIWVLFTMGLLQNIGNGLMYSTIIINCIKWYDQNKGLVVGLITGANAFSPFVFTQIQTFYLNPNNVLPDSDGYFEEPKMLSRVPQLFLILSAIYVSVGLLGVCLIFDFKHDSTQTDTTIQSADSSVNSHVFCEDREVLVRILTDSSHSIRRALKTRQFFLLWLTFALSTQTVYFVNGMSKAFGSSYISDDHYLAVILSFSSIINGIGGIFWGKVMDHLRFKDTIITINGILSMSTFSLIISGFYYQKILFAIWVFSLYFTTVGVFTSYLPEVVNRFGQKNAISIYGFIHTGPAILSIILSPILELFLNTFGWFSTFCTIGSLNAFSMLVLMTFYSPKQQALV